MKSGGHDSNAAASIGCAVPGLEAAGSGGEMRGGGVGFGSGL